MSVNIMFSSQKGGVGKSTLATLFANYLVLYEKKQVVALDFDSQRSLYKKYKQDIQKYEDSKPLYEVEDFDLEQSKDVIERIDSFDGFCVFDLPGQLSDNNLIPLLVNADAIVCPFYYSDYDMHSTVEFALLIKELSKRIGRKLNLYFIPNRIKSSVNLNKKELDEDQTQIAIDKMLSQYGTVLPIFPDLTVFTSIDVFSIPSKLNYYVNRGFEKIYKEII